MSAYHPCVLFDDVVPGTCGHDPCVALFAAERRVAELEAERDRDFERGYDQGICEALSTMSAEDAAYCRKKFPNWDKAWKAYRVRTLAQLRSHAVEHGMALAEKYEREAAEVK